jgi:predicted secreted protein
MMVTVFPKTVRALRERFADRRSRRVLFVSHCLLNENTRYMGGAFCGGIPGEIRELLTGIDCGVVQMICPERVAWGGIYKPHLYQFHGIGRCRIVHRLCAFSMPLFLFLVNWKMRWVARFTAAEITDYIRNRMEVIGIIGVRGSPACGVTCRPDLREYFEWSSKIDIGRVTSQEQNEVLRRVTKAGSGVFITHLRRRLRKRGIEIPFHEFDLLDEMDGKPNQALRTAMGAVCGCASECSPAGQQQ